MGGPAGTSAQWREGVYTPVAGSFVGCRLSHCGEACFVFCGVVCPVVLLSCPLLLWFLLCSPPCPVCFLFPLCRWAPTLEPRTMTQRMRWTSRSYFSLYCVCGHGREHCLLCG